MEHEEYKDKEIERISIRPLEDGFLYEVTVKPDEDEDGESIVSCETLGYALKTPGEVAAAVKDDLESPHARKGQNPPLGEGGRFAALKQKIASRSGFEPRNPNQTKEEAAAAIAASIGRGKYGVARFARLALKGRRG